jgi:hypothetical protein
VEDAVAGAGEVGVVGDDDEGFMVIVGELEEEGHNFGAVFGVEVSGGFALRKIRIISSVVCLYFFMLGSGF